MYQTGLALTEAVLRGELQHAQSPQEPITLHLTKVMSVPGKPRQEQHRLERAELLATRFETFERKIRDQLVRVLGPSGFDPARDIVAITVNRWPHGYGCTYNSENNGFFSSIQMDRVGLPASGQQRGASSPSLHLNKNTSHSRNRCMTCRPASFHAFLAVGYLQQCPSPHAVCMEAAKQQQANRAKRLRIESSNKEVALTISRPEYDMTRFAMGTPQRSSGRGPWKQELGARSRIGEMQEV